MPTIPACTHPIQFDEAAHVYTVAGVQRPSVTQILKDAGLIDTTWYTDEARERGRAVHLATQFIDEDDLDWDTVLPQFRGYVEVWQRFKQESHFSKSRDSEGKLLIEYLLFQPVSGYCGMLDRVGTIGATEYLIDIKTGDPQHWHGYQLAAYSQCLPDPHSRKRMTVHLRPNGSYSTREHAVTALPFDWQMFAAAGRRLARKAHKEDFSCLHPFHSFRSVISFRATLRNPAHSRSSGVSPSGTVLSRSAMKSRWHKRLKYPKTTRHRMHVRLSSSAATRFRKRSRRCRLPAWRIFPGRTSCSPPFSR